jgi:DNA-binding transcriptional ArsR family regulator
VGEGVGLVFEALADPSRRYVLERLAARGSATSTELAGELPVSRQAVAKHLGALLRAGLVRSRRQGRERRYELEPAPLRDAARWIDQVGDCWDARLDRLARHVSGPAQSRGHTS